jgi:hypothetical protein
MIFIKRRTKSKLYKGIYRSYDKVSSQEKKNILSNYLNLKA